MTGFFWYIYRIKLSIRDVVSFLWFVVMRIKHIFIRKDRGVRILVYHSIKEMPRSKDPLRMTVPPKLFERHIEYLLFSGYKIVSIDSMLDYITGDRELTGREVVLTFDDGFSDNIDAVAELLKKNGLTATYFLVVDYIDANNIASLYESEDLYSGPMGLEKISKLLSMDMTLGSHTISHINLGCVSHDRDRLYKEIKMSKEKLEEKLHIPIKYFAYPFGSKDSYNMITREIVKESGYKAAFTNVLGSNKKGDDVFKLKRTRIDWNDTPIKFKMKLEGAYDWIDRFRGSLENMNHDNTAKTYSFLWSHHSTEPPLEYHFESMQEVISERIVRGSIGLDLGCGLGWDTFIMAKNNPRTQIIGMDISEGVYIASKLNRNLKNAIVLRGAASNIPLKNEICDFVYSFGVLHHMQDYKKGLLEISRVLKGRDPAYFYLYEDHSENWLKYIAIKIITIIRRGTIKIPPKILYILACLISPAFVLLFSYPARIFMFCL